MFFLINTPRNCRARTAFSVLNGSSATISVCLLPVDDFAIFKGKWSGGFRCLSANIRSATKFAENINDQHAICFLVASVQQVVSVAVDLPAVFALLIVWRQRHCMRWMRCQIRKEIRFLSLCR